MLGQPAFCTRLVARDAQSMALLAQQGVAAVAGANALDREFFGKVHDEAAFRIEVARRVQAFDKCAFASMRSMRADPMRVMSFMLATT